MSLRTQLWLLAGLGVLLAGLGCALVLSNDTREAPVWAVASPFMMLSFIGVGLFAWWRRPHSGFGALMTAVGFVFFLSAPMASDTPALYGLGYVFSSLYLGTIVHMLLAFPEGGLERVRDRWIVGAVYGLVLGVNLVLMLLDGPLEDGAHPRNAYVLWHEPGVANVVMGIGQALGVLLAGAVIATFVERWRAATEPERRSLGPVLWTGTGLILGVGLSVGLDLVGASSTVSLVPDLAGLACLLALPYVFLLGLGRRRWFRAGAIGSLIQRLNAATREGGVRAALAEALGDPTLRLLYWLPRDQRYVDLEGRAVELPDGDSGRGVTEVRAEGRRIAALVHDAALLDDPDLVEAAGAAAALALENERLGAELRARVEELEQSRAGIIAFGLAERRRFERDLHDGAQQRLVALGLQVGMARAKLADDPAGAAELLDGAREELREAQQELRELARGLHPAVLTERGLGAAVETLVERATVPVEVRCMPPDRLPNAVETVAYFVVAEGLTNVAKYASADHASVAVERVERPRGRRGARRRGRRCRPRRPAPGCADWPTAWPPSTGGWRSSPRPGRGPSSARGSRARRPRRRLRPAARGHRAAARGGGPRGRRPGRRRERPAPQGQRAPARRRRGRRPHAADAHRRGAARRRRRSATAGRRRACSCCPSSWRRPTPSSCWPATPAGSATCSRTASPTSSASWRPCAASARAAARWTPRSWRGCSAATGATTRSPS